MDAKQFLAEFGHIVNAPEGISRLRVLILKLAVQGKLVELSKEVDASSFLLEEVKKIKNYLVSENKLPRERTYPRIQESELPVERPQHWAWLRFGDAWQLLSGRDLTKADYNDTKNGMPYLTGASNIENGKILINRWTENPAVISLPDDLLITCKGTIGKTVFNTIGKMHIARQIMAIRNFSNILDAEFLKIWLDDFVSKLVEKSKSMIPGFSRDDLILAIYPLPPLEEQKRIVAKVHELMALCDKLEAQQQKRHKLQTITRATALDALANAQSPHELKEAWQRIKINLSLLLNEKEQIWLLKQAIIDLGMSGYFVRDAEVSRTTGEDLLKEIEEKRLAWENEATDQELKEAQTMRKKLKKQKIQSPGRNIPNNWTWGSFLQISQAVVDCHNKTAPYIHDGIHLVRTTDIRNGEMDLRNTKKISQETYDYWARRMPPIAGDIFFTREAPMGEAAIVPENEKVCLGQRTMLIRLFDECFDNEFLIYAIYSPSFISRMSDVGVGATVKHLRVGGVEDLLVPVPPIEEQTITVRKIKELFHLCDQLANQLNQERRVSKLFAESAVALIAGAQIYEEEEMKIPKTELVSTLKLKVSPTNKDQAPLAAILAKHNGELSSKALWNYSGLEIDAFYRQVKTEMARDWIIEPQKARVIEKDAEKPNEVEAG